MQDSVAAEKQKAEQMKEEGVDQAALDTAAAKGFGSALFEYDEGQLKRLFWVESAQHPQEIAGLLYGIVAFVDLRTRKPAAPHFRFQLPVDITQTRSHLMPKIIAQSAIGIFEYLHDCSGGCRIHRAGG